MAYQLDGEGFGLVMEQPSESTGGTTINDDQVLLLVTNPTGSNGGKHTYVWLAVWMKDLH